MSPITITTEDCKLVGEYSKDELIRFIEVGSKIMSFMSMNFGSQVTDEVKGVFASEILGFKRDVKSGLVGAMSEMMSKILREMNTSNQKHEHNINNMVVDTKKTVELIRSTALVNSGKSSVRGKVMEMTIYNLIRKEFPNCKVELTGQTAESTDIQLFIGGMVVVIEVKHYSKGVQGKEYNKFLRDIDKVKSPIGVMFSAGGMRISGRKPFDMEYMSNGSLACSIYGCSNEEFCKMLRLIVQIPLRKRVVEGVDEKTSGQVNSDMIRNEIDKLRESYNDICGLEKIRETEKNTYIKAFEKSRSQICHIKSGIVNSMARMETAITPITGGNIKSGFLDQVRGLELKNMEIDIGLNGVEGTAVIKNRGQFFAKYRKIKDMETITFISDNLTLVVGDTKNITVLNIFEKRFVDSGVVVKSIISCPIEEAFYSLYKSLGRPPGVDAVYKELSGVSKSNVSDTMRENKKAWIANFKK